MPSRRYSYENDVLFVLGKLILTMHPVLVVRITSLNELERGIFLEFLLGMAGKQTAYEALRRRGGLGRNRRGTPCGEGF